MRAIMRLHIDSMSWRGGYFIPITQVIVIRPGKAGLLSI